MKPYLVLLGLLINITSFGKIWIVDSNVGSTTKDFTTLKTAHDGAAAGDTLYMIGSPKDYITDKVTFTKKLIVIGPGYFLNENPDTQSSILTAFIDSNVPLQCEELIFAVGSEGSAIMGLAINGRIQVNTNNILIKRNLISQKGGCGSTSLVISGSNVLIVQNYILGVTINASEYVITVNPGFTNVIINNNYMSHNCNTCGSTILAINASGSSMEISNNVINGGISVTNALIQNNVFTSNNTFSATTSIIQNNIHLTNQLPGGNGNLNSVPIASIFTLTGSTDGQWSLKSGSTALGAGFGGTDCGMFGGVEPYVLSGIPPVPSIYSIVAPLVGDKVNGLPVQIKVKSRN
ncbi:hypothetical protein BH10BAC4_BH10BAC4_18920 [soil metagenome]